MAVCHPNGASHSADTPISEQLRGGPRTTGLPIALLYLTTGRDGCGSRDQHAARDAERGVDVVTRYIQMRDGAQARRVPEVARYAQTLLGAGLLERARVHGLRIDLEGNDVRDDLRCVDADTRDAREAFR